MASENHTDQSAASERKLPKDPRSSTPPSLPLVPRIFNDGPELLRSNHC